MTEVNKSIEQEVAELAYETARQQFTMWFAKNYPGPRTIITNPDWHAPKVFQAAFRALMEQTELGKQLPRVSDTGKST